MEPVKTVPKSRIDQQFCPKCRKTLKQSTNFYVHHSGEYDELCKKCLTMRVDPWDTSTFFWLLQRLDVPYIKGNWNIIRDRAYAKDPIKFNPGAVFGKYLCAMKLRQHKTERWADTERLNEADPSSIEAPPGASTLTQERLDMMKQALEAGEISEAQYQTFAETAVNTRKGAEYVSPDSKEALEQQLGINTTEIKRKLAEKYGEAGESVGPGGGGATLTQGNIHPVTPGQNFVYPSNGNFEEVEVKDVGDLLTPEDKIYLAMKWGRLYKADEWVALEKLYHDFTNSIDIQGAARIDTLKMICKTSLKANQAIDCGDIDAYQRLSRVYDSLMKSGAFTEAQNKEEDNEKFNSIGQIVAYCEKNGGVIPRFKIEEPMDIIDKVIQDMKDYTKTLIYEDKALAKEIEAYIKKRELQQQKKMNQDISITDKEFIEYSERMDKLKELDEKILADKEEERKHWMED